MQVYLNSLINKSNFYTQKQGITKPIQSKVESLSNYSITFMATPVLSKTISSQIAHEKSKLLKQINDILAQEVKLLTSEEKLKLVIKQASNILKSQKKKLKEIEFELDATINSPFLNPQQKNERVAQLRKEYNKLNKLRVQEPVEKEPSKDNYDFTLINKFKTAILNDNFDLAEIEKKHYKGLQDITTVEEFKKKYPSIRIPANPKNVITKKIIDTLDRNFYIDLYSVFIKGNEDDTAVKMMDFFQDYFNKLSEQFEDKDGEKLLDLFCIEVAKDILAIMDRKRMADELASVSELENIDFTDNFDDIPIFRKKSIANIFDIDKLLLDIDYDSFVMNTIKKLYLDKEKLNQIEYIEGDKKIKVSTIKAREYEFEKIPEKMKKIISDAQKIGRLQRDYQKFTDSELKSRLTYYTATEIGNHDEIFSLIVDFDSCKFTQEDKIYLIKFLELLDKANDKELAINDVLDNIKKDKIHPRGTVKLNELERKKIEEKIKIEQQKLIVLNNFREEFNQMINSLYDSDLSQMIENMMKYYPETLDEISINDTKKVMNIVKNGLISQNVEEIKTKFARWEIFNEHSKSLSNSKEYQSAINYGKNFDNQLEDRAGQYLLNRELIDAYPASLKLAKNPDVFSKIMEKFSDNEDLATIYLCKYDDYLAMRDDEKSSILKILEIFDAKNSDDRVILKSIIESDYINSDTVISKVENGQNVEAVITSKAKEGIIDKYMFPICIDFFVDFEEALTSRATEYGSSGIKKTGMNNNALGYKMELKIKGYPDRLFSSKNDYVFDIYSERGLH